METRYWIGLFGGVEIIVGALVNLFPGMPNWVSYFLIAVGVITLAGVGVDWWKNSNRRLTLRQKNVITAAIKEGLGDAAAAQLDACQCAEDEALICDPWDSAGRPGEGDRRNSAIASSRRVIGFRLVGFRSSPTLLTTTSRCVDRLGKELLLSQRIIEQAGLGRFLEARESFTSPRSPCGPTLQTRSHATDRQALSELADAPDIYN